MPFRPGSFKLGSEACRESLTAGIKEFGQKNTWVQLNQKGIINRDSRKWNSALYFLCGWRVANIYCLECGDSVILRSGGAEHL